MPGFEYIGIEEKKSLNAIFTNNGGVLAAQGFDSLRKGNFLVRTFEKQFSKKFNTRFAVATTSGTASLFVALKSLGIKKNDEVIIQTFTFIAVAEAVISLDAKPVFVDIDETLNIDLSLLEKKITSRTKAIISAGMLGSPIDFIKLKKISKKYKIPVIDDNCESLGSKYKKENYGNIFDITVWSFDAGKTLTTGEGGMITTNKIRLYKYCKEFIDHGHENNYRFSRGNDTKSIPGFNFRMTELQAAVGLQQLKKLNKIISDQKKNYLRYSKVFKKLNIKLRQAPKHVQPTYDTIILNFRTKFEANKFLKFLKFNNLPTKIVPDAIKWHFVKYWQHMNKYFRVNKKDYKRSEELLNRTLALPILGKSMKKKVSNDIYKISLYNSAK
jgi:8-amino-3,8-dideoxy-alpha-D-manno-octulosonate transaminase